MDTNDTKMKKQEHNKPETTAGDEMLAGQTAPNRIPDAEEYLIDASGKRLGRVASEAASILLGKHSPAFQKHTTYSVSVKIENASKLDITERRGRDTFERYTGYPGGRKVERLDHLAARRGYAEVLRRVIAGMLPKNRLHKPRMHNLTISE